MTLDTLIFKLQLIRDEAKTGNLLVLFRDPNGGVLYDEFSPCLSEVVSEDNPDLFDAFDLQPKDYYVEI